MASRTSRICTSSLLPSLVFLACTAGYSAQAPDNSGNNKQPEVTADQQSNAAADRATTQKIRKALIADKSLSTYAHNVKIITRDGMVTLKGPVKSEDERQKVVSTAAQVVDESKIDDELAVSNR